MVYDGERTGNDAVAPGNEQSGPAASGSWRRRQRTSQPRRPWLQRVRSKARGANGHGNDDAAGVVFVPDESNGVAAAGACERANRKRLFRVVGSSMQFPLPTAYREAMAELRYAAALMRSDKLPERPDCAVTERDVSRFVRSRYRLTVSDGDELVGFADTASVDFALNGNKNVEEDDVGDESGDGRENSGNVFDDANTDDVVDADADADADSASRKWAATGSQANGDGEYALSSTNQNGWSAQFQLQQEEEEVRQQTQEQGQQYEQAQLQRLPRATTMITSAGGDNSRHGGTACDSSHEHSRSQSEHAANTSSARKRTGGGGSSPAGSDRSGTVGRSSESQRRNSRIEQMVKLSPELDLAEIAAEIVGPELWRASCAHSHAQALAQSAASDDGAHTRISADETYDFSDDNEMLEACVRLAFRALADSDSATVITKENVRDYMGRVGEKELAPLLDYLFSEVGGDACDLQTFRHLLVADFVDAADDDIDYDDCDAAFEALSGFTLERDMPTTESKVVESTIAAGGQAALAPGEAEAVERRKKAEADAAAMAVVVDGSDTASTAGDREDGEAGDVDGATPSNEQSGECPPRYRSGAAESAASTAAGGDDAARAALRTSDNGRHTPHAAVDDDNDGGVDNENSAAEVSSTMRANRMNAFSDRSMRLLRAGSSRIAQSAAMTAQETKKVLDMVLDDARSLYYTFVVFLFFMLTFGTYGTALISVSSVAWSCSSRICVMAQVLYAWVMLLLFSVVVGLLILVPLNTVNCRNSRPATAGVCILLTALYTFMPFFVTYHLLRVPASDPRFDSLRNRLASAPFTALMIATVVVGGIAILWQAYFGLVQSAWVRTRVPLLRSSAAWIRRPRFVREAEKLRPWGRRKTLALLRSALELHERMRAAEDDGDMSGFVEVAPPRESFGGFAARRARYYIESNKLVWGGRLVHEEGIVVPTRILIAQMFQYIVCFALYGGILWLSNYIVKTGWSVPGSGVAPNPWVVYLSFVFGGTVGFVLALVETFMVLGSYRMTVNKYRRGRRSLTSRVFFIDKDKLHRVSFGIGISIWCTLWGFALGAVVPGGALFLVTWSGSRTIALGFLFTWLVNAVISVTKNTVVYGLLNRMIATQLYRRGTFAFILTDLAETAWIITSGLFWLFGRVVIYLLLFVLFIGRIDSNPWNTKLEVLDGFSGAFVTVALAYDAHWHPYVNRLCSLLMRRTANHRRRRAVARRQQRASARAAATTNGAGNGAAGAATSVVNTSGLGTDTGGGGGALGGAAFADGSDAGHKSKLAPFWRLLMVLTLMPDLMWYRAQSRVYHEVERQSKEEKVRHLTNASKRGIRF